MIDSMMLHDAPSGLTTGEGATARCMHHDRESLGPHASLMPTISLLAHANLERLGLQSYEARLLLHVYQHATTCLLRQVGISQGTYISLTPNIFICSVSGPWFIKLQGHIFSHHSISVY